MRSLRTRLFLAILGTVLVAVGASLALGVVLTKSAVRDTIRNDVENQADAIAAQLRHPGAAGGLKLQVGGAPPPGAGGPPGATPALPGAGTQANRARSSRPVGRERRC